MKEEIKEKKNRYRNYLDEGIFGKGGSYSASGLVSEVYGRIYGKEKISATKVLKAWESFLKKEERIGHLSLYTHIPYCYERCHYCYTTSSKLKKEKDLEEYVKRLVKYYRFFENTFKGEIFDNLYIGGGTPSILSEELLELLFSELFSRFQIGEEGERTFENDPRNSSMEKLKIVKRYGINRVSFGVQTFNEEVLRLNNRTDQTEKQVEKAIEDAKKVGFDCINIDLMVGLYGEDEKSIIQSFKKALKLEPDSVSIYTVQPVGAYLERVCNMRREEFFEHRKKIMDNVLENFIKIAEKEGYHLPGFANSAEDTIMHKHLSNADCLQITRKGLEYNPSTRYVSQPIHELNSILGLGRGSGSAIPGALGYEMIYSLTDNPAEYKFKGVRYDIRKEMLKNIINTFSNCKLMSFREFRDNFGKNFLEEFGETVQELEKAGVFTIKQNEVRFNCEDPKERFIYLLFFFDDNDIINYMEKIRDTRSRDNDNQKEIEVNKNLQKKLKLIDEKINKHNAERTEGRITQKSDNEITIYSEKEGNVKMKIKKDCLFVETFLREDDFWPIKKEEITFDKLTKGDSVVASGYGNKKEQNFLLIQKISVIE